jgi:hypothetical protein
MRHWLVAGTTGIALAATLKATRHSRVFFLWFVSFLRQKRNEHPQAIQLKTSIPNEELTKGMLYRL